MVILHPEKFVIVLNVYNEAAIFVSFGWNIRVQHIFIYVSFFHTYYQYYFMLYHFYILLEQQPKQLTLDNFHWGFNVHIMHMGASYF